MVREVEIHVRLTADEALVLSDWLFKWQDQDTLVDDASVQVPLRRIGALLEKKVPMIFASDYTEQVEAARQRLLSE